MSEQWYFRRGELQLGPLTTAQLREAVDQGLVRAGTPIRCGTEDAWVPAAHLLDWFDEPRPVRRPAGLPAGRFRPRPILVVGSGAVVGMILGGFLLLLWQVSGGKKARALAPAPPPAVALTVQYDRARLVETPTSQRHEFPFGREDRFREVAPEGGVLVGVQVTIDDDFGHSVTSVQPIYRVGDEIKRGQQYGRFCRGNPPQEAIAKPGYAVGALHCGSTGDLSGFEVVFMRLKGDRLDLTDSYLSPWLGSRRDFRGFDHRQVSGEGRLAVGLHGRAGSEVAAVGLVVVP